MTCALGYYSKYAENCDLSQFGEGCERCLSVANGETIITLFVLVIIVTTAILYYFKCLNKNDRI